MVHVTAGHGDVGDIRRPDLVGAVNGHPAQHIGINRVPGLPPAGAGFWGQRFDSHEAHQSTHAVSPDGGLGRRQVIGQGAASFPGMLQVKLIDPAHQFPVSLAQT